MSNLFKKVVCFGDIHFGQKSNSIVHNQDCEDFVDWMIDQSKAAGAETCIFLGDWSHNRNNLNLSTLDSSIRSLEKLGKSFEKFFWFPGNHDLFYKDKRTIHSTIYGKHIPGVNVINDITTIDNVTLVPWLVGEEWKNIGKAKSKYIFGHLELPSFYMNAMVQMPDHGVLQPSDFKHQDLVFSGHFHKRQNQGKIWYIGNAFPHNYSDAGDDERGIMFLEWGGQPEFVAWNDAPKYRVVTLSELIDKKDSIMKSKMHLRVHIDIDISFEESNFIKETFINDYDIREISLIQEKNNITEEVDNSAPIFESVDQIVLSSISSLDSQNFNKQTLLSIYENL